MTDPQTVLGTCPICGSPDCVRLVPDWQAIVNAQGRPIPIIGCGNPWHYIFPDDVTVTVEGLATALHDLGLMCPDVQGHGPEWHDVQTAAILEAIREGQS
jgi:hypothetical protein